MRTAFRNLGREKIMEKQKKIFTDHSLTVFLGITILASAVFETLMIAEGAMGLAVFLMWVPAAAAIVAGCISQKAVTGKISVRNVLKNGGFKKTSFRWILLSCLIPLLYIGIPYLLFWILFPKSLCMKGSPVQLLFLALFGILLGLVTALGEEAGWRGYLVPAVLERVGLKKTLLLTSLFWGVWHLPILVSGLYMPGTPVWYKVPAFFLMILPVGSLCGLLAVKTKSVWPAVFFHAAHNTLDQTIFGKITIADNKMFFVSETGIFTIVCAWILLVICYRKWKAGELTGIRVPKRHEMS